MDPNINHPSSYDFLKTSKLQFSMYVITGILFMVVCLIPSVLKLLGIDTGGIEELRVNNNFALGNFDITSISSAVLWFLLGCVIYLLLWGLIVFLVDGYNNIIVSSAFMHPKSFHRSSYWAAIVGRVFIRITSGTLLLSVILLTYSNLVPFWSYRVSQAVKGGSILDNGIRLLVVLVSWIVIVHLCTLLLRLFLLKHRILS